ncbi:tRNA (adenine(22)-N(1))-methyltransferase [Paenibacillus protaetiae]|uniref:SAM-dependent methyltransferase n=1 Tax=Paenibacillus protaetiae TaxID=2509456 RepID=A0A4P6EX26_9BACL|nr:tRNA (adenine(22)-N(1))-methyltransferase TrmK [Paenibacillus protaetiae]QAY66289.1 SAM-dependent methyltransferase [Paenibacillus protaetiae]
MLKLSSRLQNIAQYVTEGSRVADIGSDHALLPVYLVQSGKSPSAIAGELNTGPLLAARKQVAAAGLSAKIEVRQGNGLAVLQPGEADTVTIAGMGGSLMKDILEEGFQAGKLEGVRELVLQPNIGEELVRQWLVQRGWHLAEELIMEEDGKIYELLHAVRLSPDQIKETPDIYDAGFLQVNAAAPSKQRLLLKMGPYLLRKPNAVFFKKWKSELAKLERVTAQLALAEQPGAEEKLQQFKSEMDAIQEVLQCLQTDKPSFS